MALAEQNIDVPLSTVDQKLPKTGGLTGSFSRLIDCQVVKYQGAPGTPPNLVRADKRDAFVSLSDVVRSVDDGTVQAGALLSNQTLLEEFAGQEILVANDQTHVYSNTTAAWERHGYQLPAQALSQDYIHTSNSLATTPDVAEAEGVYCYAWVTEAAFNSGGGTPSEIAGCYFRVMDSDGVVLRSDTQLRLEPMDMRVKVVSDGQFFWIFSEQGTASGNFNVYVVDRMGVVLKTTSAVPAIYGSGGYWDITPTSFGILLAQANNGAGGIEFVKFLYDPVTNNIAATAVTDTSIAGNTKIGFLTNDLDANAYLATSQHIGANNNTIRAYRIPATLTSNHTYNVATTVHDDVANLTGYVSDGAGTIVVAWSTIDPTASPNTEYLKNAVTAYQRNLVDAGPVLQSVLSMNLASRAFKLGQSYYAVGYYPSDLAVVSNTEELPNQPTYFLIPLSNPTQRIAGRFEYAAAYCDWQVSGSKYNFALASVVSTFPEAGVRTALSYRAESFTSQRIQVNGDIGLRVQTQATTVGVKSYTFGAAGKAVALANEILLPGPIASTWSGGDFTEHGIALAFEQPLVTLVPTTGTPPQLTPGTYQWVVVGEWTDTNGKRVRSLPSPPFTLTVPAGNTALVSGYMNHVTSKRDMLISIYRTDMVPDSGGGFVPTTIHYKVTLDAPAGSLAPLYNDNSVATWSFADTNTLITANEILYTDKGQLGCFPAPPFKRGCIWQDRVWLIGPDKALWFSSAPTEGDALWFHPGFRLVLPTNDEPMAIAAATEGYLLVLCEKTAWYVPAVTLPDSSGANGSIPAAVELKFNMGCTGEAIVTKFGCVYSSSAGGLWLITRDLQNLWLSEPLQDTLSGPITALAIDSRQRVYAASGGTLGVYDLISQCWYEWNAPGGEIALLSTFKGQLAFGDGSSLVFVQSPGNFVDSQFLAGVSTQMPYFQDMTLNSIHFGGVRNFASLLEMQLVGDTHTASTITMGLEFDDATGIVESTAWATDPAVPLAYSYGPANQLCSAVGIRLTESLAAGQVAGQGFSLEALALTVGLYQGQNRLPDNRRV